MNMPSKKPDYGRAVELRDGIFWIGFYDQGADLHCNPYLIKEGDEAVIIDGGSRPDFPKVMMKILQTGIDLNIIRALIYQHYDPDLCGSLPNLEDLIDSPNLMIISQKENIMFIRHYSARSELVCHDSLDNRFRFASGRTLKFIKTPFAHTAGSFMTFDEKTGTLFSSDLFGSYGPHWELFLHFGPDCRQCQLPARCPLGRTYCPLQGIENFHRSTMPSEKALRHALKQVDIVAVSMVAPQHGSVIHSPEDIRFLRDRLAHLKGVGIDGIDIQESGHEEDAKRK